MSISPVNQLVASIRGQLAGQRAATPGKPVSREKTTTARNTGNAENGASLDQLIAGRIRQIERDAPNRGKKAFRVFLEAVLLAELGEQLMHDPGFYNILDDVQNALTAHPATQKMVEQATAQLLQEL
jgi:hypothetical protein